MSNTFSLVYLLWKNVYSSPLLIFISFFKAFIYLLLEGKGERKKEASACGCLSSLPPTRDLARNPGMCPDGEWNQRPFGLQAGSQSTEPHQPGLSF